MREFKVNDYITLKLENKKTVIYVAGKRFLHCKFLLLQIDPDDVESLDDVESIDAAAERLNDDLEPPEDPRFEDEVRERIALLKYGITPETEFWGHCSNLQAWAEHNYDTRLLHSNLAFPLLEELAKAGDPLAKRMFKEEVAKRLSDSVKTRTTFRYLHETGVVKCLTKDEYLSCILDPDDLEALIKVFPERYKKLYYDIGWNGVFDEKDADYYIDNNKKIVKLYLLLSYSRDIPEAIGDFKNLKDLTVRSFSGKVPASIGNLKNLEYLFLDRRVESIPATIGRLKKLKILRLSGNKIRYLPQTIGKLKNLEELYLYENRLQFLPDSIGNLKKLRILDLSHTKLKSLPGSIGNLSSLEKLSLDGNKLTTLPESIGNLSSLKELYL
ncbi:MAG: leucine-rich repeat domain-containing protein, partial [Promethearchaeota archaeon]